MENDELKKDLPRLQGSDLEKAARLYKAKTGVGCDGFHLKVPFGMTRDRREEVVEFLEKAEQSGKCPQQACTAMFFLIPKNVTSERPIALVPTLMPTVAKWQQKYRVDWDPTDGRNQWREQYGKSVWRWTSSPDHWADVCGFLKPPGSQRFWKVNKHGALSIPRKTLGLRPNDQSCHHETWLHLDFVDWSNTWSKQNAYEPRISLKERPAECAYWNPKRRISEIMSDNSLS